MLRGCDAQALRPDAAEICGAGAVPEQPAIRGGLLDRFAIHGNLEAIVFSTTLDAEDLFHLHLHVVSLAVGSHKVVLELSELRRVVVEYRHLLKVKTFELAIQRVYDVAIALVSEAFHYVFSHGHIAKGLE